LDNGFQWATRADKQEETVAFLDDRLFLKRVPVRLIVEDIDLGVIVKNKLIYEFVKHSSLWALVAA